MDNDNVEKYFCAIIRKPQEGKTFICLENIYQSNINSKTLNIIITMNTIKSNKQFFERANNRFGEEKICILNSKSKTKDIYTAKDAVVENEKNIIIMCAHHKRIDKDITKLLDIFQDSKSFNEEIRIHIDEAHAYVPCHRDRLIEINNIDIVEKIYFYSATPFNIWQENYMNCNSLFKNIYIIDIDEQYKNYKFRS